MAPDPKKKKKYAGFEQRLNVVAIAMLCAFCVLAMRLWQLQIVDWADYTAKSEENRLRIQRLEAPRGMILAKDGGDEVVVADNRSAPDLMFVLADCDIEPRLVCDRLEELARIDGDALFAEIELARKDRQPHRQITIKRDVPRSVLARVEEYAYALPGVFTVVRPQRRYLYGRTGGQILGYLGEIGPEELERKNDRYHLGDLIGKSGVERMYEDVLHGTDGQMLVTKFARGRPQLRTDAYGRPYVEVDDFGHPVVGEEVQDPTPGESLHIEMDMGLQAKCESLLEGGEGAIAVLNAETGGVLALASAPGYDPSVFVTRGMGHERLEILKGKPNKMLHRAYQERYPPGSVFKVMLATAALEEGVINENTTFYCSGKFHLQPGGRPWHCWRRSGHGRINVVDALAYSCDVFFYNVGLELGVDKIHEWGNRMGMGIKTGLDLPGEITGLVPSKEWRVELLKKQLPDQPWNQQWFQGDTVNLSIGQGDTATTPLQNAVLMACIINGGYRVRPYLNASLEPQRSENFISPQVLEIVRRGMRKCIEKGPPAPTGTGKEAAVPGMVILGKTGSAQIVSLEHHEDFATEADIPLALRDHAWFVCGVLDQDPPIAMCILVEHGHHGSSVAAPLAKEIIEYFYHDRSASTPGRVIEDSDD